MAKYLLVLFILPFFASAVEETDIVSWWPCDEESGTREDVVGDNDLTDNNTVLYAVGKVGNACDFEGTNSEYLSITDANQTGLDTGGDFSVVFWAKHESEPTYLPYVNKWGYPNRGPFDIFQSTSNDRFYLYTSNNGTDYPASYVSWNPSNDTWYFIALTYDESAGGGTLYINGVSQGTFSGLATTITDTAHPFKVGGTSESVNTYYDGLIDELVFFNVTLETADVTDFYNDGNGISYDDFVNPTSSTTSTTTTTTADVTELMYTFALYMSVLLSVLFAYIGYRFTKIFV